MNLEVAQRNEDGEKGYVYDEYTECSKQPIHNQFEGNDLDHSCMEIGVKEAKPPSEDSAGSLRSRPAVDNLGVERNKSLGVAEQRRFPLSIILMRVLQIIALVIFMAITSIKGFTKICMTLIALTSVIKLSSFGRLMS
ncbi:hypothetical protein NMG60_11030518 [Bertholletia excelsa]